MRKLKLGHWKYQVRQKMWIYWQSYSINHKQLWAIAALKLICTRGGLADLLEAHSLRLMDNWAIPLVSPHLWTSHISYHPVTGKPKRWRVYIDWEKVCHLVLQSSCCQDYYGIQSDRPLNLTRYQRSQLVKEAARFEGAPNLEDLNALIDRELAQEYLSAIHDYVMGQL